MRIYISGPMSGHPESNFPAFHAVASALRGRGYDVVNPAEINVGEVPDENDRAAWHAFYHEYLRADIRELCTCDAIAMMDGWEFSKGAHLELHIAHRVGMRVTYVRDLLGSNVEAKPTAKAARRSESPGTTVGLIERTRI